MIRVGVLRRNLQSTQRGVGLPAAIFIITLMVVIAAAINLLVEQNARTFEEEINLTRAFYAAESGAGFVMNSLYPPESYPTYPLLHPPLSTGCYAWSSTNPPNPRLYNFIAEGLNLCSASVTCTDKAISGIVYSTIESTGTCGNVKRTVQIRTVYEP